MSKVRENWDDYDGVGEKRAEALRELFESPSAFVEECEEEHPNKPMFATLRLPLLEEAEHVGNEMASAIIDQMLLDIQQSDEWEMGV